MWLVQFQLFYIVILYKNFSELKGAFMIYKKMQRSLLLMMKRILVNY